MPTPRGDLAVGVVDGILYAVGGRKPGVADTIYTTVEAYNPDTDSWTTKAPLPAPCWGAGAVDGILYVVGCGATFACDPKIDSWSSRAPKPTPTRLYAAVATAGGVLYVMGGLRIGIFQNETYEVVEAYDPKTDTWATKASLPTGRCCMASGTINGLIFVAGGRRELGRYQSELLWTLLIYNPMSDTWTTGASLPEAESGMVSGILGGKLYAVGSYSYPAYAYDPSTDSWQTVPPDPTRRTLAAGGVIDDIFYVVGGLYSDVNEAFSPFLHVGIDIKPGDSQNSFNLKSGGVISAAILGSATFDPMTVDPITVTLAGASVATRGRGVPMISVSDVNHDGFPDLLLFFRTQDLKLAPTDTQALLYGETYSGQRIRGSDSVRIVPPPKASAALLRGKAPRH